MAAISTTVGQFNISYALGCIYIANNSGFVVTEPYEAPRDVGHLISLAADACARQAKAYLDAYRDIATYPARPTTNSSKTSATPSESPDTPERPLMTREDLKKHWEVIEAFKNGQDVEFFNYESGEWVQIESPAFQENIQYRIAKRDWAWACEMMLAGKRVKRSGVTAGDIFISSGTISCVSSDGSLRSPAPVYASDLLATDWRLA